MDVDVWDDNISRAWFNRVNSGACCQGRKVQVRIGLRPDVMVSEDRKILVAQVDEALCLCAPKVVIEKKWRLEELETLMSRSRERCNGCGLIRVDLMTSG